MAKYIRDLPDAVEHSEELDQRLSGKCPAVFPEYDGTLTPEALGKATGESVELGYVDQGYTGGSPAKEAKARGMGLEVVGHEQKKRGFVLLPRRWVVERDLANRGLCPASRFRRLFRDYERLRLTLAELHCVAFACHFLQQETSVFGADP